MESLNSKQELLKNFRHGVDQPERSGEYWDEKERENLRSSYDGGIGLSQISLELGRSEQAIVQQLIVMDLFTPAGKNRFRTAKPPRCLCGKCQYPKSQRPCLEEGGGCSNAGTVG